jgi:hypothetical protein
MKLLNNDTLDEFRLQNLGIEQLATGTSVIQRLPCKDNHNPIIN